MADNVSNELLLEHLKSIQAKLGSMERDIADIKTDMRALKTHMSGFMQNEVVQDGQIASHRSDLDRIKRCRDLADPGDS